MNICVPGSIEESNLAEKYIHLVQEISSKFNTKPAEDLYSAGLVGLLNAIRNFDSENGAPLECYIRFRIKHAVMDEVRRIKRLNFRFGSTSLDEDTEEQPSFRYEIIEDTRQKPAGYLTSRAELSNIINKYLNKLPERQKEILSLFYIKDVS